MYEEQKTENNSAELGGTYSEIVSFTADKDYPANTVFCFDNGFKTDLNPGKKLLVLKNAVKQGDKTAEFIFTGKINAAKCVRYYKGETEGFEPLLQRLQMMNLNIVFSSDIIWFNSI